MVFKEFCLWSNLHWLLFSNQWESTRNDSNQLITTSHHIRTIEMVYNISSANILPCLLQHAGENRLLAQVPATTNVLLVTRFVLEYETSKNCKNHEHKPFWNSLLKRRRGILAQIKAIPNISGDEGIVSKCNSPRIITRNLHSVRLPTISSTSVEIDITYLICTWSRYLKCIGGTPFKCSCWWIIQPWCINLIAISITKRNTDLITSISWRGTACWDKHRVVTAPCILD